MAQKRKTNPGSSSVPKRRRSSKAGVAVVANEPIVVDENSVPRRRRSSKAVAVANELADLQIEPTKWVFYDPIADSEARITWPIRYMEEVVIEKLKKPSKKKEKKKVKDDDDEKKSKKKKKEKLYRKVKDDDDEKNKIRARRHFKRAIWDKSFTYEVNDDAHVESGVEGKPFICKIVEMFEGVDGKLYFTAQWFYKACDTVIGEHGDLIDGKRVFLSEIKDTNELNCLLKKLKILMISSTENTEENCDYYCDMHYSLHYSTLEVLQPNAKMVSCQTEAKEKEATMLDLYSGCGAMSTGLCMGAQLSGLKLVNKWAVDMDKYACQSLKHNHPETEVRNMSAGDFLLLLKEWEKLCFHFSLRECPNPEEYRNLYGMSSIEEDEDGSDDIEDGEEIFVVERIDDIKIEKSRLYMKVKWQNYGPLYDTWEPIEGLSNCRERIKEFVVEGYEKSILPLPGGVDVVCGGPPCQGISGYNRYRNTKEPLADEKNKQLIVYMDIVEFLKPKYVLMENVVDMLRFVGGHVARYAVGRLVQMNYQTRMGMMAAGAYGLAQYRMRFFLWGAQCSERLPQFPLPTHDVIQRGDSPVEFWRNVVAYPKDHTVKLGEEIVLSDVITDLPAVTNDEKNGEMEYDKDPITPFQHFIRLRKDEMLGSSTKSKSKVMLFDHHPLNLNKDDYQRVCRIPKKKGANFRDLPGVMVRLGNKKVAWDPKIPRVYLESKRPLVPEYAMKFVKGRSSKPFGRLWWDETVGTVITRAEPHNHIIIHPHQDRVLTVRENARLQGFSDYYQLFGPTKEKYKQVGNAVAVPVGRALGYAFGHAFQGLTTTGNDPLLTLPEGFPNLKF